MIVAIYTRATRNVQFDAEQAARLNAVAIDLRAQGIVSYHDVGSRPQPVAKRPALRRLIDHLATSKISAVVVNSLGTLARRDDDLADIAGAFGPMQVGLFSLKEGQIFFPRADDSTARDPRYDIIWAVRSTEPVSDGD